MSDRFVLVRPTALLLALPLLFAAACGSGGDVAPVPAPVKESSMPRPDSDSSPARVNRTDDEWKALLTPEQYRILREKGTERPWTGEYNDTKTAGEYRCAGCDATLFRSEGKFDSHCGWPAFDRSAPGVKIEETRDTSHGMVRTEVTCPRCGGHLGHLFDDGPTETGMRYCINSVSIKLKADDRHEAGPPAKK